MPENQVKFGGQAVIEGVMMRGQKELAVAVRKKTGNIIVKRRPFKSLSQKFLVLGWPFLRGIIALGEALVLGIQALTYSANQAAEEEDEELTAKEIFFTIAFALIVAILFFIVLPTGAVHFLKGVSSFWKNLIEGLLRIAIFLLYIVSISRMEDIKRVFQYHGAEHKVIYTYEAGEELTVENAKKYSTLHPRCGTAFLFMVLLLTIIIFSFLNTPNLFYRIISRVLLMPAIAGIAYEFIKLSGKYSNQRIVKLIIQPGLWLQKLTTKEPDDKQIEVAIEALRAVINDRADNK